MDYSQMTDIELLMEKSYMEQVGYAGEVQLLEINEEIQKRFAERKQQGKERYYANPNSKRDMNLFSDSQKQIIKDIQENFVDDFLNFEDTSVGWYAIGKFDQRIVDEINDDIEGVTVVSWGDYEMTIECDGLEFYISLPYDDSRFTILKIYF